MTPEEQYNALVVEKDIAEDNVNRINRDIEKYVKVIEGYSKLDAAAQGRLAPQMQQVLERYNNLKNERYAQEDRYWVATKKINEHRALDAAQQPTQGGGQRRRTYTPQASFSNVSNQNGARVIPEQLQQMSRNLNYNNPQRINTSTYIPSWIKQPTNNTNNKNIPTNSQTSVGVGNVAGFNPIQPIQSTYTTISTSNLATPLEVQSVQRARGNDYLRGMRDLENMGYTVFNQKAYKDGKSWDLK